MAQDRIGILLRLLAVEAKINFWLVSQVGWSRSQTKEP